MARRLLARIPRLEEVAEWIGDQMDGADHQAGTADHHGGPPGDDAPPSEGAPPATSSRRSCPPRSPFWRVSTPVSRPVRRRRRLAATGRFPQELIDALVAASERLTPRGVLREISALQVRAGMLLEDDLVTTGGLVLLRKGERVSEVLAARLANFARSVGVVEPVRVLVRP